MILLILNHTYFFVKVLKAYIKKKPFVVYDVGVNYNQMISSGLFHVFLYCIISQHLLSANIPELMKYQNVQALSVYLSELHLFAEGAQQKNA